MDRRQPRQDRGRLIAARRVLVLGSTGLLGQEVMRRAGELGWDVGGAARSGAEHRLDVADLAALEACLAEARPDIVVNCAAIVDLAVCERDPGLAFVVNARPAALLAAWSREPGRLLVHISTDHFFAGDGPTAHDETAPVTLLNDYARSKYAGETLALTSPNALVLRTSIVGIRGWAARTFAEWAIDVVERDAPATLFADAFTSSVDTPNFASALFDLVERGATGLFNLAAREVYSKEAFVREIARQMGRPLSAQSGRLGHSELRRATALGLDVSRASALLSRPLPSLEEVVASLLTQASQRAAP